MVGLNEVEMEIQKGKEMPKIRKRNIRKNFKAIVKETKNAFKRSAKGGIQISSRMEVD